MVEAIDQVAAPELVQEYYYDYAKFINMGGRTVPFYKDTLKAVQRRLLYASYTLTKSGSFVKSARIVGETMGKYHPHGNLSLDQTLANMVQVGLLEGRGNFGSTVGVDPIDAAASRYTEARIPSFIKDTVFKYIDYVPYFINDLGVEEPEYLPTMLPLNLIQLNESSNFTTGIGVGLSFTLPMFTLKHSVKFMISLIKGIQSKKEAMPLAYRNILVDNTDKLFNTGVDTITIPSLYSVINDGKEINITEFSPGLKIKNVLSKLGVYVDKSKDTTDVVVKFDRGKRATDYDLDKLLSSSTKFQIMFHNNEKIRIYSVTEAFLSVYNTFKSTVLTSLNKEFETYQKQAEIYALLQKVKPHLNPLNEKTKQKIIDKEKLDEKIVTKLLNYSIDTFCKADELEKEAKQKITVIKNKIDDIDTTCLEIYQSVFD